MKSEKGITLISLTIYIIVMTIVVAVMTVISTFFYSNLSSATKVINPSLEYTKFNSFFSDEVNHSNIKVLECKTKKNSEQKIENSYVVFDNGVQYTFISENKGIYRNKVKITRDVEDCTFDYQVKNGKNIIVVNIKMDSTNNKKVEYTLKN